MPRFRVELFLTESYHGGVVVEAPDADSARAWVEGRAFSELDGYAESDELDVGTGKIEALPADSPEKADLAWGDDGEEEDEEDEEDDTCPECGGEGYLDGDKHIQCARVFGVSIRLEAGPPDVAAAAT